MTGRPAGRTVVVAGGTGLVGAAVVRRLVADGHRVVVPTRGSGTDLGPDVLVLPRVDWERPDAVIEALVERAPSAAVVAVGGWWLGPQLVDLDPGTWRRLLESHLTAHYLVARALAPVLVGPDPAYLLLGGAAATEAMAGSGPVSVTGAGQRMLLHVLRAEPIGARVRFHEVAVRHAVDDDRRNLDPAVTVTRDEVAAAVADVLADPASSPVVEVP